MATKKEKKSNFETALKELELIVGTIEQGGISLEKSLELFTKGVTLTKECQEALKSAEQKVKILTGKDLVEFEMLDNDKEDQ